MVQSIPHKLPNYHVHKVHEIPKLKEVHRHERPVTLSDTEWTPLTVKVINHDNNVQESNYVHDNYVDDMIYDEEIFAAPTLVSKRTYNFAYTGIQ